MYTGCIHKVLLDDPWWFNNPITLQFTFEVKNSSFIMWPIKREIYKEEIENGNKAEDYLKLLSLKDFEDFEENLYVL